MKHISRKCLKNLPPIPNPNKSYHHQIVKYNFVQTFWAHYRRVLMFPCLLRRNTRNSLRRTCSKIGCAENTNYNRNKSIYSILSRITHLLFVEFESVLPPCTAVSSTFSLNCRVPPLLLLLLLTMFSSSCILGAIILAKTYVYTIKLFKNTSARLNNGNALFWYSHNGFVWNGHIQHFKNHLEQRLYTYIQIYYIRPWYDEPGNDNRGTEIID